MPKKLRKAVLPVAGLGTRFLPATKALAKEMLPVVDKPLIQYAVEEARAAGIEQFCFVTGRGKTALVEHFDIAFELEATLRERGRTEALAELDAMRLQPGAAADRPPTGAARPGPRHLVRPRVHRRRTVRRPAARRPDPVRHALHEATGGRLCDHRRQCRGGLRGAARTHQPLWDFADRRGRRAAGRGARSGGKAGAAGGAVDTCRSSAVTF